MTNLNASIGTSTETLPSGSTFSNYSWTVYNQDGSVYGTYTTGSTTSISLTGLPNGLYSVEVYASDSSGNAISPRIATLVELTGTLGNSGTYQVPSSLAVTGG